MQAAVAYTLPSAVLSCRCKWMTLSSIHRTGRTQNALLPYLHTACRKCPLLLLNPKLPLELELRPTRFISVRNEYNLLFVLTSAKWGLKMY